MVNWVKGSLYRHTFSVVLITLLGYILIAMLVATAFGVYPLLRQSVDDLSGIMLRSRQQWEQLDTSTEAVFIHELDQHYRLHLRPAQEPLNGPRSYLPFVWLLEQQLSQKLQHPLRFYVQQLDDTWYWARFETQRGAIDLGFSRSRIGTRPPLVFFFIAFSGLLLAVVTSAFLARKLTSPLKHLMHSANQLGQGDKPDPIPEQGALEIRALSASFNHMASEVDQLLQNRTTLLVGVSHNLRSPIARLKVAAELLPEVTDDTLRAVIQRSLDEMDDTIGQFLALARAFNENDQQHCSIDSIVQHCVEGLEHLQAEIQIVRNGDCEQLLPCIAMKQVVDNLLENAIRYSRQQPVQVQLNCDEYTTIIDVLDQGPGIEEPMLEHVFQPFARLEDNTTPEGGTGLGLAIARLICQRYGWQVNLFNRAKGGVRARVLIRTETH